MHKSTLDQGLDIGVLGCLLDQVPAGAKPVKKERGAAHYVIGHSESGHHPVLVADGAKLFQDANASEGMRVLYAILKSPGQLKQSERL